jgi:hypothetical protein
MKCAKCGCKRTNPIELSPEILEFANLATDYIMSLSAEELQNLTRQRTTILRKYIPVGKASIFVSLSLAPKEEVKEGEIVKKMVAGSVYAEGTQRYIDLSLDVIDKASKIPSWIKASPDKLRLEIRDVIIHELTHAIDPKIKMEIFHKRRKKHLEIREQIETASENQLKDLIIQYFNYYYMDPLELDAFMTQNIYTLLSYIDVFITSEDRIKAKSDLKRVVRDHARGLLGSGDPFGMKLLHVFDRPEYSFWKQYGGEKVIKRYLKKFYKILDEYPEDPPEWLLTPAGERYRIALREKLKQTTPIDRPRLGVVLEDREDGIYIAEVLPRSIADKAGIKPEDKIIRIDGKEILNAGDMAKALHAISGNSLFNVSRNGTIYELTLSL